MTHPLPPFRDSKHVHNNQSIDSHFNEKTLHGSGAVLTCGINWQTWPVSTSSILTVHTDGKQRSLENFQFDLENVLTMSQLIGKSAEERNGPR